MTNGCRGVGCKSNACAVRECGWCFTELPEGVAPQQKYHLGPCQRTGQRECQELRLERLEALRRCGANTYWAPKAEWLHRQGLVT